MKSNNYQPGAMLVRPRVYFGETIALGPGKIDLLRAVGQARSIAAAARTLGLPYKRAWLLIDSLNQGIGRPLVVTATGGKGGGGAQLSALGEQLVQAYDALEKCLNTQATPELDVLSKLLKPDLA